MKYPPHDFDALEPGATFELGPRTITRADIDAFTEVSGDRTALHCDDAYAAGTPFGQVVAHGVLSLAAATGLAYAMGVFGGTVLAVRQMHVAFERPVTPGDEVSLRLVVVERDSRPKADRGRVTLAVTLSNQRGRTVLSGSWSLLVRRGA